MTVEELKLEAAKLPLTERVTLVDWMASDHEVCVARQERLRREIQVGLEQADRGVLLDADEVFSRLRAKRDTMR